MQHRMISHDALAAMSQKELQLLSQELREFLVQHMAKTGGHLASNLGIVELTLAIHKVYDTEKDRLLFDVGHQSYVHKILTGRQDQFATLRTFGGLSGFPKPSESVHDPFIAGHASDSVSVAVGMARARTLSGADYDVVAVLGDGALTGGLAYEGLNDAGESGEPLVVVLNDNGMSITPNVGAVSKYLALARLKPGYFEIKKWYRQATNKLPGGRAFYNLTHRVKTFLRKKLIGVTLFEEMGFQYLGPVDGHDVEKLTFLLREAKEMRVPVLLHVITQKGKGFAPAEMTPAQFHGVGKFDPETGLSVGNKSRMVSFSDTFGKELCRLASEDTRICAITAAMEAGTGLGDFAETFPDRYYDVGIAEGHAVCMAAGLAKQGMLPVFAVYSTFLQRSFDMLIHDVSLLNLHVVFAVDRAGLVGEDGETHHGVFDVGYLRQIPGMQILCPTNQNAMRRLLHRAIHEMRGPVAIRYSKGCDGRHTEDLATPQIRTGQDLTIVTYGVTINDVLDVCDLLQNENSVTAEVICLDQIAPLNIQPILDSVRKTGKLLVVEETAHAGCIGTDILAELSLTGISVSAKLLNLGTGIVTHGDLKSLRRLTGLDAQGIYIAAKELL
jgi:1-deoxy-D-xylulose-5-phosphate synthase